jgi:glycosyltransferase involved in cell wall biosynthesis
VTQLRITAILTTHLRPALMLRALASLGAELRRPDEILVVEDGDAPDTAALLRASGVPCRLVQRSMANVAKARNLGLAEARGDWVVYLDDDDVAYPCRCLELEAAALGSGCPLVFGATLKLTAAGSYPVPTHHPPGAGPAGFQDVLTCMPHINSVLFRRQDLADCGGFPASGSYFSDLCVMLQMLDRSPGAGGAWRVDRTLAEFRAESPGLTHGVARELAMKAKLMEAFDLLDLGREPNRRSLGQVREALEQVAPFPDYDAYVALASAVRTGSAPAAMECLSGSAASA